MYRVPTNFTALYLALKELRSRFIVQPQKLCRFPYIKLRCRLHDTNEFIVAYRTPKQLHCDYRTLKQTLLTLIGHQNNFIVTTVRQNNFIVATVRQNNFTVATVHQNNFITLHVPHPCIKKLLYDVTNQHVGK